MNEDITKQLLESHAGSQWKEIGVRHHHGICLPLFSIHSEQSCGIGEFTDLHPLLEWCHSIGMDVIQLLPLNDTGDDTSPYNALSAMALNPVHLGLSQLPHVEEVPNYAEKLSHLRRWNHSLRVKYGIVRELKKAFLIDYFRVVGPKLTASEEYQVFVENNPWVIPYALFKALKEKEQGRSWEDWPTKERSPSSNTYEELLSTYREQVAFHCLLQFLCFEQFSKVKEAANRLGMLIKGDLPILISRDSADVWSERYNFLLHLAAGAPPDMYSKDGQYWGFPLYDWEELEKRNYAWWTTRLQLASQLYHLYRLDHVVGFFRIWAIGLNRPAVEGFFIPADKSKWIDHGRKLMQMMLHRAPILPIGEDLGLVPDNVKQCLAELGICGTKMMRWERRWEGDKSFISIKDYEPQSMTTVSTHDSDTLQLWWRHYPVEAKAFAEYKGWDYRPFLSLARHKEILWDSHHSNSLFHINLLQEYLALFPELVSDNPNDERINIPGKTLETNWSYKFRPSIEQLIAHIPLKEAMKEVIS